MQSESFLCLVISWVELIRKDKEKFCSVWKILLRAENCGIGSGSQNLPLILSYSVKLSVRYLYILSDVANTWLVISELDIC